MNCQKGGGFGGLAEKGEGLGKKIKPSTQTQTTEGKGGGQIEEAAELGMGCGMARREGRPARRL